jgi:predicted nucleic acid-binding protein
MGSLIDTNVWSELQKGERANPGVCRWYHCVHARELYFSVLVIGELRRGIDSLRRRDAGPRSLFRSAACEAA